VIFAVDPEAASRIAEAYLESKAAQLHEKWSARETYIYIIF
jgi:hypothetical protein